jgi:predicted DNA-binding transcriptional regulator YafY
MDPSAATVLKLAERYLKGLLPAAVLENIDLYLKRATVVLEKPGRPRDWLDSVAMVPKALPLLPPTQRPEVANVIFQAIKNNHQLHVQSYTRNSPDTPKDYIINPLGIVLRDSSTYLVWTAVGDAEERLKEFVLHRIGAAEELDTIRDVPVGFDLAKFIYEQQGFGYLVQGEPENIQLVLEVEPILRFTLSETPLAADQVIEPINDGRYRVSATVKNTHQLRAWIMEKSPQLRVVAPTSLQQAIVELIKQALQQYQSVA